MTTTKTLFCRRMDKSLKALVVVLAIGMASVAAYGLGITGDATCERILRPDRWFLIYRQSGTLNIAEAGTIDILLEGGGGGGGQNKPSELQQGGGGGGGGGVVYKTSFAVTPGSYQVTVGEGGAIGMNGGNTSVSGLGLTAYGGGAGAN